MADPLKIQVPALSRWTRAGLYTSFVLLVATTSGVIFGWPILQSNAEGGGWSVAKYMQSSLLVVLLSYSGGGFLTSIFLVRPILQHMGLLKTFWIYLSFFLFGGLLLVFSLRLVAELMFPAVILLGIAASCLLNFYYELTPYIEHCNAIITVSYSLSASVFQLTTIPMPPEVGLGIWLVLVAGTGVGFYFSFKPYFRHLEDRFEAVNEGELRLLDHDADLDQELVSENVGETIEDQNGGPPVLEASQDKTPYLLQVREYCGGIKNLFRSKECWLAGLIVLAVIANQSYFYGTYYQRSMYYSNEDRTLLDAMLTVAQVFGAVAGLIVLMNVHYAIVVLCTLFLVFSISMAFQLPLWLDIVMFFFMTVGSTGTMTCCMALSFKYAHTLSAEAFCYFGMIVGNIAGPTISFFFQEPGAWSDILCAVIGSLAFVFSILLVGFYLAHRPKQDPTKAQPRELLTKEDADLSLNHDDMSYMYPYDSHHMSGDIHTGLGSGQDDGMEISEISAVQPVQLGRLDDGQLPLETPTALAAPKVPKNSRTKAHGAGRQKSTGSDGAKSPGGKRSLRSLQDQYAAALSSDSRPTDSIPQELFSWEAQVSPDASHRSTSSADLEEVNRAADIMWKQRLALRKPRKPQQDRFTEDGLPVALADMIRNAPPLVIPKGDPDAEDALDTIPQGSDDEVLSGRLGARGNQGARGDPDDLRGLGGFAGLGDVGDADGLDDMQLAGVVDGMIDSADNSEDETAGTGQSNPLSTGAGYYASQGHRTQEERSSSSNTGRRETGKSHGSSRAHLRKEKAERAEKASLAAGGFRRRNLGGLPMGDMQPEPGVPLNPQGGPAPSLQDEGLTSDIAAIMGGSGKRKGR